MRQQEALAVAEQRSADEIRYVAERTEQYLRVRHALDLERQIGPLTQFALDNQVFTW